MQEGMRSQGMMGGQDQVCFPRLALGEQGHVGWKLTDELDVTSLDDGRVRPTIRPNTRGSATAICDGTNET